MKRAETKRLVAFGLVGSIGFLVDGGVLTLLSQKYGVSVYISRLFSFLMATLVTWLLNRALVFKGVADGVSRKRDEYGRYFLVQVGGALLNLGVFSLLLHIFSALHAIPVIPLAIGAVFGLAFNYSGARYWVFKKNIMGIRRV
ncbi:MAG TPA: GtrA family protein [Noviherbaspirillum sp.]